MSWIARSIANSLKFDDDITANATDPNSSPKQNPDSPSSPSTPSSRGVKEDLSELTKTVSRQLWGVASFLAPPPQPSDHKASEEDMISGIRGDFAEISGKFKTGISKLSTNITVSEITKLASNFLLLGSEEEIGDAVGVTEEVVAFARNISMHPETWLDFPLPDYEDSDGIFPSLFSFFSLSKTICVSTSILFLVYGVEVLEKEFFFIFLLLFLLLTVDIDH